jgi:hypothetical protein
MSIFRYGNIWDTYDISDIFIITGNSYIRNNNSLVMGKGIALETRNRFPGIDKIFGKIIVSKCGHLGIYNLIKHERLYLLQTKIHFRHPSSIELITEGINKLKKIIKDTDIINMVFPGIGYGGLTKEEVYGKCLMSLPNNITIWHK